MKKLLAILFLIIAVQGIAETVVKGTYETKRKRYVELTQTLEKEIFLNYTLPDNKKEIVTYKGKDFDILVSKNDLLELYNRRRVDKIDDIKNKISYKDEKFEYFRNYFSELIENNKAVVYDRKNEKEINYLIKVKYNNAIFYDNGGGSLYNGYNFYADKEWTELALQSDVITQFGVEIHSSIGDNPYNRELSEKEKERFAKQNLSKDNKTGLMIFDQKYKEVKQIVSTPFTIDANQMRDIKENVYTHFGTNDNILQNKFNSDEWSAYYEGKIEPFAIQASMVHTNLTFTEKQQSFGNAILFTANRLQYLSNQEKLQTATQLFDRGFITRNQGREIFNMAPTEDGNKYYIRKEYAEVKQLDQNIQMQSQGETNDT